MASMSRKNKALRKRKNKHVSEHLDHWVMNRILPNTFTIYIGGDERTDQKEIEDSEPGVEFCMADRFEQNLTYLSSLDPKHPIKIIMATSGGYWDEGMQMMAALLACPNPTTLIGLKHCRSMSSIIPLAADKFVMRPPAQYMYHWGTDGYDGLSGEQYATAYEQSQLSNRTMLSMYTTRLLSQGKYKTKSTEEIRAMLVENMQKKIDVFLSAKEAVEAGFADGLDQGNTECVTERNEERRAAMWKAIGG